MLEQLSVLDPERSDVDLADPDLSGFHLKGWNILVRPVSVKDHLKTSTGSKIFLPTTTTDDINYLSNVCKVLKLGSLAFTQEGFRGEAWCKEGDYVLLPKLTGTKIRYKGVTLTMISCDRVLAVLDDPREIDQNFQIVKY